VFRFTESRFAIETSDSPAAADAATQSHLLRSAVRRSPLLELLLVHFGNLTRLPDDTVMNKWALALGPEVIENLHKRVVTLAQEKKVVEGRKMRVDTIVVETNIHYPTDSSLLGDGVRVLTRAMKRIANIAGNVGPNCGTAVGA
jgi:hypothetical protein